MKPFSSFCLILMLAGVPALASGSDMPDSVDIDYFAEQAQPMPQSHDDENPDDGDEEKEDDDYD